MNTKTSVNKQRVRLSWRFLKTFNTRDDVSTSRSWGFLRTFCVRHAAFTTNWQSTELMQVQAQKIVEPNNRLLTRMFNDWNRKLSLFGGDPSTQGEKEFRPLRLSREEDWSDWLKELLEKSMSGVLAATMFVPRAPRVKWNAQDFERPEVVERETPAEGQEGKRRGDILVKCRSKLTINLEVKVGDKSFAKTFETARMLRRQEKEQARRNSWHDFILLPEESTTDWESVASEHAGKDKDHPVHVVLWGDVARGLRRSLWEGKEPVFWRAWAWTFCGRIENKILNLRRSKLHRSEFGQLGMALRWLNLLETREGEKR